MAFAGLGQVGGSLVGTGLKFALDKELMEKGFKWQQEMRATAYQTAVQDARAAGLNPLLVARLGGNAAPPASAAQAQVADLGRTVKEAVMTSDQRKLLEAQKWAAEGQSIASAAAASLAAAQGSKINYEKELIDAQTLKTRAEAASALKAAGFDATTYGQIIHAISKTVGALSPLK